MSDMQRYGVEIDGCDRPDVNAPNLQAARSEAADQWRIDMCGLKTPQQREWPRMLKVWPRDAEGSAKASKASHSQPKED